MELQAEPWEPGMLVHLDAGSARTGLPEQAIESYRELRQLGYRTIFLWGAEYWQFRRERHRDRHWWNTVVRLLGERLQEIADGPG
jgi:hypothetical protein